MREVGVCRLPVIRLTYACAAGEVMKSPRTPGEQEYNKTLKGSQTLQ